MTTKQENGRERAMKLSYVLEIRDTKLNITHGISNFGVQLSRTLK
jgi:hypothetical protein